MNNFKDYFSLYEATDPPPIITKGYQKIKDSYINYLNYVSSIQPVSNHEIKEDVLEIETEPPKYEQKQNTYSYTPSVSNPISGRVQQSLSKNHTQFTDKKDYVKTMYRYLHTALENNGIDGDMWAPVLVAQTSIESNWGNEFSRKNNNFAGIKGKGSGLVETKEWDPKKGYYTIKDSFKSYPSIEAFADDYVKRLKNRFKAFDGTPEEFSKNIRSRGYFTARLEDYQRMMDSRLNSVITLLQS